MVSVFRRNGEPVYNLDEIQDNPAGGNVKAIAKEVIRELEGSGVLMSAKEYRALEMASSNDELFCEACGTLVSGSQRECSKCGHDRARPAFQCTSCSKAVDPNDPTCRHCNASTTFLSNFSCENGHAINPSWPSCPECGSDVAHLDPEGPRVRVERGDSSRFQCEKCGFGIASLDVPRCPRCGHGRAIDRTKRP